jgi:Protein of unknown function (DUF3043)
VFRRRSNDASGLLEQDEQAPGTEAEDPASRPRPGFTAPKGAPTPKRSEAQANRRQPYQAPADRKAAAKQSRVRNRGDRITRTEAYQRGEQWALPRKDQGPVRALARDVVDARRGIGEYYMIMIVVAFVLLLVLPNTSKFIADGLVLLLFLVMLIEGWLVGRKVKSLAAERYPQQSTQGATVYATMRGITLRRMRVPKPRVKRGDAI